MFHFQLTEITGIPMSSVLSAAAIATIGMTLTSAKPIQI